MVRIGTVLVAASALMANSAISQTLQSDTESRAYYCLAVEKRMAELVPPWLEDPYVENVRRLNAYLLPNFVAPTDSSVLRMVVAQQRAASDLAGIEGIGDIHRANPAHRRLLVCGKLDWLPF